MATKVSVIFDELNELAVKYNVPQLRGIALTNRKGGKLASMGDGTLKLNAKDLHKTKEGVAYTLAKTNYKNKTKLKTLANWKQGDDIRLRPTIGYQYFDNDLDQIRQVMYHEFGHHVHQMRYVSQAQAKVVESTYSYGYSFIPEVERKITKIANRSFPTNYAKENGYEWFAENFSLYNMNKVDLVDPEFIKLIKEIAE